MGTLSFSRNQILRRAFLASVPVLTGYICLGFGFGVLLIDSGFSPWLSLALSVFLYAGAMQYLAIGLLAAQASLGTLALTTLMVNLRYTFYSVALLNKYRGTRWRKPYLAFALTDETFSLIAQTPPDLTRRRDRYLYFFAITLFNQIYWVVGCMLGSLIGGILPFSTKGVDFALTALFLCIATDQWLQANTWQRRTPAIIGGVTGIVFLVLLGPTRFLIPTMLLIVLALLLARPTLDVNGDETRQKGD